MSGLKIGKSLVSQNVNIQPSVKANTVKVVEKNGNKSLVNTDLLPQKIIKESSKIELVSSYDLDIPHKWLNIDTRTSDKLPTISRKISSAEEITGIASFRPHIISLSNFIPLYDDQSALTAAGKFLDAQVQISALRHDAMSALVNQAKKDEATASLLSNKELELAKAITDAANNTKLLSIIQANNQTISSVLDLTSSKVDIVDLLKQSYSLEYQNSSELEHRFPAFTYFELLEKLGYTPTNLSKFSSTKCFLQTLYEAKKIARSGSDSLINLSLEQVKKDADPAAINKRAFKDPHVLVSNANFPNFQTIQQSGIFSSDTKFSQTLKRLENSYKTFDVAYASTGFELSYALKVKTYVREIMHSNVLSDQNVVNLLGTLYGYNVSQDTDNQTLFDAVIGAIGDRITDDHSNANQNTLASTVSSVVENSLVLLYERRYSEDDSGNVYTPGSEYYVGSAFTSDSSNPLSYDKAEALVARLAKAADAYARVLNEFSLLPEATFSLGGMQPQKMTPSRASVLFTNTLYNVFIASDGKLKKELLDSPFVELLSYAATSATLRANLLLYFNCLAATTSSTAGVTSDLEASQENSLVGATLNKLASNCYEYYNKFVNNDPVRGFQLLLALRAHNNDELLNAMLSAITNYKATITRALTKNGYTYYSHVSDLGMMAFLVQLYADSAKMYSYSRTNTNVASNANTNFKTAMSSDALSFDAINTTLQQSKEVSSTVAKVSSSMTSAQIHNKEAIKNNLVSILEREEQLTTLLLLTPLASVRSVLSSLNTYISFLKRETSQQAAKTMAALLPSKNLIMLNDPGQVRLINDVAYSYIIKAKKALNDSTKRSSQVSSNDDISTTVLDDSIVSKNMSDALKSAFFDAKFNLSNGNNLKLLSVGLPHGFSNKLETELSLGKFGSAISKQLDIVKVEIYKLDVRYPDLIFKPQVRVFELSRFASRDEDSYKNVQVGVNLKEVLESIPTVDYSHFGAPTQTYGADLGTEYDFMSQEDKLEMVHNTVLSRLLELYTRTLTGISISEQDIFASPDVEPNGSVSKDIAHAVLNQAFSRNLNVSVLRDATVDLSKLKKQGTESYESSDLLASITEAVSLLSSKKTLYSDAVMTTRSMLSPRKFERIFHVAIDPDDYEIDVEKTKQTKLGVENFNNLLSSGRIVASQNEKNASTYRLRDMKLEPTLAFDKFIVVVKSYDTNNSFGKVSTVTQPTGRKLERR